MANNLIPHFPLERVKSIAVARNGLYLQRTRAQNILVERTGSSIAAYQKAREIILSLELGHFAKTVQLPCDIADIYGFYIQNEGWYLKITIDESIPEVAVISLHPLEHPLRTRNGVVETHDKKGSSSMH